jgi:hypothetical protein
MACHFNNILSRNGVTTDGVWIVNRVYWTRLVTALHKSPSYTVQVFSVTALLGNIFQRRAPVLPGWHPSHTATCSTPIVVSRLSHNQASYRTTEGQSASLSWYQATIWDPRTIFLSLP